MVCFAYLFWLNEVPFELFGFAIILWGFLSDYANDSPPSPKEVKRTTKVTSNVKAGGNFNKIFNKTKKKWFKTKTEETMIFFIQCKVYIKHIFE